MADEDEVFELTEKVRAQRDAPSVVLTEEDKARIREKFPKKEGMEDSRFRPQPYQFP